MNTSAFNFKAADAALLIVDIQERLFGVMDSQIQDQVVKNTLILIEVARELSMPVIVSEQYRKGLGLTVEVLREKIEEDNCHEKVFFDCMKDEGLCGAIEKSGKKSVIVTGIEAHVCVFQTALSLAREGYTPFVVNDAVASRRKSDWRHAMDALTGAGVAVIPTESVAFMALEKAGTPEFKKIAPLFK